MCNKKSLQDIIEKTYKNEFDFYFTEDEYRVQQFWKTSLKRFSEFEPFELKISNIPLGIGGYGSIYLCQDTKTLEFFVLKDFNDEFRNEDDVYLINKNINLIKNERNSSISVSNKCSKNTIINQIIYDSNTDDFIYDWTETTYKMDIFKNKNHIYLLSSPVGISLYDFYFESGLYTKNIDLVPIKHSIICQLIHILDCLFKSSINHCDLKPENIIILEDGTMVLIDYGASFIFGTERLENIYTEVYSPPEKCKNHKSDIYSIGIIINYILFMHDDPEQSYTPLDKSGAIDLTLLQDARNFVKKLTVSNNDARPTINDILTSDEPWNNWYKKVFTE
jgi:serine/threonine protein kinase